MVRWHKAGPHNYVGKMPGDYRPVAYVFRPKGAKLWRWVLAGKTTVSTPEPTAEAAQNEARLALERQQ